MLDADDVAECAGAAAAILSLGRVDPSDVPYLPALAARVLKSPPVRVDGLRVEGDLTPTRTAWTLRVRRSLTMQRASWVIGHELGHWWYLTHETSPEQGPRLEAMCDAIGAALVAPPQAFRDARKHLADRVHRLAEVFSTTQALALLRVGEVTGRPACIVGPRARVRGEPFVWGDLRACLRGERRQAVHPIWLPDERRWGLMAAR